MLCTQSMDDNVSEDDSGYIELKHAEIEITDGHENWNDIADDLYVVLRIYNFFEKDFIRVKLIDLLEDGADIYMNDNVAYIKGEINFNDEEENTQEHKLRRLRVMLCRAYYAWKNSHEKYTPDELKRNPIPVYETKE